jgi:N-acetylglutamate synthase
MITRLEVGVDTLESAMAAGWWPLEHEWLGSWLLRASAGFTGRGNSALPIGDPGVPMSEAIDRVETFYRKRDLPPRFSVPRPVVGDVASGRFIPTLIRRGYAMETPTAVMTARAHAIADGPRDGVRILHEPDEGWLSLYRYRGQTLPPEAAKLLTSAPFQRFASVVDGEETVAVGRVAVGGGWGGITAMEVAESHRRLGLGRRVLSALARQATFAGVGRLYLQVDARNRAARALYASAGFRDHHGYHYRVRHEG